MPDSHLDELQSAWDSASAADLLLEPPLLAAHKQQERAARGLFGIAMLQLALSGDCTAAALPEEEEQTSLAQLWNADGLMKHTFATQLMHEPLQPLPGEEHRSWCLDSPKAGQPAQQSPCELPQILTCPRPDGRAVREGVLSSTMQPLSLPEIAGGDIAPGLTFHDLVAPGQILCDEYPGLPLVHVKNRSADSLAALSGPAKLAQDLQARSVSLAAAELLLDWSMKDPAVPDPSKRIQRVRHAPYRTYIPLDDTAMGRCTADFADWLGMHVGVCPASGCRDHACSELPVCAQAREKMKQALRPQLLQQPDLLPPLVYWQELIQQLTGPPAPRRGCLRSPEQLHAMVQRVSKRNSSRMLSSKERLPPPACSKPPEKASPEPPPQGGRAPASSGAHGNIMEAGAGSQERAQEKAVRAPEGETNRGVFLRARKRARGASRQQGQDAAFFMGLQRGASEPASEVSGSSDDSLADG